MTLTKLLVPTFQNMLQTLSGLLDKAEKQMPDRVDALMTARITADMLPLASQIRFVTVQASEAVLRLSGAAIPVQFTRIVAEARDPGAAPDTFSEGKARIDDALSFLASVAANALDSAEDQPIALEMPGGIAFDMTGAQYARD